MIIDSNVTLQFIAAPDTPSGVIKIAHKVAKDCELVTGCRTSFTESIAESDGNLISIKYSIDDTWDKIESFRFKTVEAESAIYITGSEKRGTIYGLFHISDLLGVSPLVNWSNVVPRKKNLEITDSDTFESKEPSVRYRGFFINDEWPCFGTWCNKHFGGFTAEMYEGVFEMLLRMKGNYLWPAMWSSCFAEDGPGLASAELADELGVVMGLSHHEPCLRHGEEYSHVRGKDSIYGDAWNFRTNREGITRFWRDGLKRNGHLENVITIGMRGERDSKILGEDATLKDNIDLLRDVIKTQNQLITEEVNPNLSEVPRMLALYKEVEPYYYGNQNVEGLKGSEDLEDVILLLCDDNHGYVRSLPDEEMRRHKGGFGMYYHFDYHGDPVSYEWINSTYLPEVWEQMTTAYEHGVQSLWIVNVGDLGLNEMPLSYFLDLAYDYDKWGISNPNSTEEYLDQWMQLQFGGALSEGGSKKLTNIYVKYTRLIHNRRPEHLNENVYHPQNYYEAREILRQAMELEYSCGMYLKNMGEEYKDSFKELFAYNVLAGVNLVMLWYARTYNHFFASMGSLAANNDVKLIQHSIEVDDKLRQMLHTAADGKWDGFGLAEHIGFKYWNSEECAYPILETVIPVRRPEIKVGILGNEGYTSGQEWTKKKLVIDNYYQRITAKLSGNTIETDKVRTKFFVALSGDREVGYTLETDSNEITFEGVKEDLTGTVTPDEPLAFIDVVMDRNVLNKDGVIGHIYVTYELGKVEIELRTPTKDILIAEVQDYINASSPEGETKAADEKRFVLLKDIGRRESGMKVFPVTEDVNPSVDSLHLDYQFEVEEAGNYKLIFQMLPTNPYSFGKGMKLSYAVNPEKLIEAGEAAEDIVKTLDVISDCYEAGVTRDWEEGVLSHVRYVESIVSLDAGKNIIRYYAHSRENVLERIILVKEGVELPKSYLGPTRIKGE